MNIILIGFKNSGKTTIGKQLAEKLEWPFLDTDDVLRKFYNHIKGTAFSIPEIYQHEQEAGFRAWEYAAIESLAEASESLASTVVATGGGSVLLAENVALFKKIGKIIYLYASAETLLKRQENTRIPAFVNKSDPEQSFLKIYAEREPLYQQAADQIVDVENKDNVEILTEILLEYDLRK